MNYYNPYFTMIPNQLNNVANRSLFSGLTKKGFSWSSLISGTQKTLNIINQAIPVIKQVSPVVKNAKTMFRVMNEFKRVDTPNVNNLTNNTIKTNNINDTVEELTNDNSPTFFI